MYDQGVRGKDLGTIDSEILRLKRRIIRQAEEQYLEEWIEQDY